MAEAGESCGVMVMARINESYRVTAKMANGVAIVRWQRRKTPSNNEAAIGVAKKIILWLSMA